MLILLSIWMMVGTGIACIVARKQRDSAGLPLAYFLGLSLIHVPGALLYLDGDDLESLVGFEQTVVGMVAFLFGVAIARFASRPSPMKRLTVMRLPEQGGENYAAIHRLALKFLAIGCMAFFVIMPIVGGIGTVTAIVASLGSLMLAGICLQIWVARKTGRPPWLALMLLPLMPLATLVQGGFIGFGTFWALAVLSFMFAQSRLRAIYVVSAPIVFFVGLSVFVNYMAARAEIRQLVWIEQAGLSERLQRIADMFDNFEWLDLSDGGHRKAINDRLNQNILVGAAVRRLESGEVAYANGRTAGTMVLAVIPRVIWPDKPQIGGGGTIVRDFTGIEFAEGTSVGAGQVLEFYVNFGIWGVIGGFLLFGYLIGRMDLLAMSYLLQGDQKRFLLFFLIGLAMLDAGGNLIAIEVTAVSSAITALAIGYFIDKGRPNGRTAAASISR